MSRTCRSPRARPHRCVWRALETGPRCGRLADGRIGCLPLCRACVAAITGLPLDDRRLDASVAIEIDLDTDASAFVWWEPWPAVAVPATRRA
jgi:hypothetical protein